MVSIGLLLGLAGVHTTHNPATMLSHDKHGYPLDFVTFVEPNLSLLPLKIPLNPGKWFGLLAIYIYIIMLHYILYSYSFLEKKKEKKVFFLLLLTMNY